jgi:hypothetical protein
MVRRTGGLLALSTPMTDDDARSIFGAVEDIALHCAAYHGIAGHFADPVTLSCASQH